MVTAPFLSLRPLSKQKRYTFIVSDLMMFLPLSLKNSQDFQFWRARVNEPTLFPPCLSVTHTRRNPTQRLNSRRRPKETIRTKSGLRRLGMRYWIWPYGQIKGPPLFQASMPARPCPSRITLPCPLCVLSNNGSSLTLAGFD